MSAEMKFILEVIPSGHGLILDLGGGKGMLRYPLEKLGYQYINLDIRHFENGEPSVIGDAHVLPFKDETFNMVISKDTLEHFLEPWVVVKEVHRILKESGQFIVWVPFMHPFHGDDFYRYTPLGLRHLLHEFDIIYFDSPQWVFTVMGLAVIEVLKHLRLGFLEKPVKKLCYLLDGLFTRRHRRNRPASFANAYRIVARK